MKLYKINDLVFIIKTRQVGVITEIQYRGGSGIYQLLIDNRYHNFIHGTEIRKIKRLY